jgi:hypothetical protein
MATKRTVITLTKSNFEALRKSQNVSRSSIYNALSGATNSETAQQIRRLALSTYGGVKTTKVIW